MKKILFIVAFIVTAFTQGFAQEPTLASQPSQLLTQYYSLKDALVAGNGNLASAKAAAFLSAANSVDTKLIAEATLTALIKDATVISETKDIKKQREQFANLSNNMVALAKTMKLSANPVYQAYCPMKKAAWLSSDKTIKNPYYGTAMLSCGKVVETINQ